MLQKDGSQGGVSASPRPLLGCPSVFFLLFHTVFFSLHFLIYILCLFLYFTPRGVTKHLRVPRFLTPPPPLSAHITFTHTHTVAAQQNSSRNTTKGQPVERTRTVSGLTGFTQLPPSLQPPCPSPPFFSIPTLQLIESGAMADTCRFACLVDNFGQEKDGDGSGWAGGLPQPIWWNASLSSLVFRLFPSFSLPSPVFAFLRLFSTNSYPIFVLFFALFSPTVQCLFCTKKNKKNTKQPGCRRMLGKRNARGVLISTAPAHSRTTLGWREAGNAIRHS